jgi:hypothetical protein
MNNNKYHFVADAHLDNTGKLRQQNMASKFGSLLLPTLTTLITCRCAPERSKVNPENKTKV